MRMRCSRYLPSTPVDGLKLVKRHVTWHNEWLITLWAGRQPVWFGEDGCNGRGQSKFRPSLADPLFERSRLPWSVTTQCGTADRTLRPSRSENPPNNIVISPVIWNWQKRRISYIVEVTQDAAIWYCAYRESPKIRAHSPRPKRWRLKPGRGGCSSGDKTCWEFSNFAHMVRLTKHFQIPCCNDERLVEPAPNHTLVIEGRYALKFRNRFNFCEYLGSRSLHMDRSMSQGSLLSFRGTHEVDKLMANPSNSGRTSEYLFGFAVPVVVPPLVNSIRIPQQKLVPEFLTPDDTYCSWRSQ
jgi:hypothetical protein